MIETYSCVRSQVQTVAADFPTPAPVIAAAQRAIADGGIYYTSALGLPELRAAIATHYRDHLGVEIAHGHIVVTAGS